MWEELTKMEMTSLHTSKRSCSLFTSRLQKVSSQSTNTLLQLQEQGGVSSIFSSLSISMIQMKSLFRDPTFWSFIIISRTKMRFLRSLLFLNNTMRLSSGNQQSTCTRFSQENEMRGKSNRQKNLWNQKSKKNYTPTIYVTMDHTNLKFQTKSLRLTSLLILENSNQT